MHEFQVAFQEIEGAVFDLARRGYCLSDESALTDAVRRVGEATKPAAIQASRALDFELLDLIDARDRAYASFLVGLVPEEWCVKGEVERVKGLAEGIAALEKADTAVKKRVTELLIEMDG